MSFESVKQYFNERGIKSDIFELGDSGATVELASKTIGVPAEVIAKTLAFRTPETCILVVMKGDARVDNKKFKQYFKVKAKMLNFDEVEQITGHPVGGVCPFGLKESLPIYLDKSIKQFPYVYPAAGSKTSAMKIAPNLIQELTNATWIDVCNDLSI